MKANGTLRHFGDAVTIAPRAVAPLGFRAGRNQTNKTGADTLVTQNCTKKLARKKKQNRLFEDILIISRIASGRGDLRKKRTDLPCTLQKASLTSQAHTNT